jgi:hypothetical protein
MRASLTNRIGKLEGAIMQRIRDNHDKPTDLSMLSMEELEVVEKVLDYTLSVGSSPVEFTSALYFLQSLVNVCALFGGARSRDR